MPNLAQQLQGEVFLAARYADEHWLSVPIALDAIADSVARLRAAPGPGGLMVRFLAGGLEHPLRHARGAHAAADRPATVAAIAALAGRATTLGPVWDRAFPLSAQPALLGPPPRPYARVPPPQAPEPEAPEEPEPSAPRGPRPPSPPADLPPAANPPDATAPEGRPELGLTIAAWSGLAFWAGLLVACGVWP